MSEVIRSDLHYQEHTGVLTNRLTQPTENLILDRNAELRKNPGVIQDLGSQGEDGVWGRQVASIPFIAFHQAKLDGFDLESKNKAFGASEMNRFLQSPAGKACLVQGD